MFKKNEKDAKSHKNEGKMFFFVGWGKKLREKRMKQKPSILLLFLVYEECKEWTLCLKFEWKLSWRIKENLRELKFNDFAFKIDFLTQICTINH